MANTFAKGTLLTPGTFYDALTLQADKDYFTRNPVGSGASIPLSGLQVQGNMLALAKFAVDINARVAAVENLDLNADSLDTGYLSFVGKKEAQSFLYGGAPLAWTSSITPLPLTISSYYDFYLKEGAGIVNNVPYLFHYDNLATYSTASSLATYLNSLLTQTTGFLLNSGDLTSISHDWATAPASFEVIIDDDEANTYTLTLINNVTSASDALSAMTLAISAAGLATRITATLVGSVVRLTGTNTLCSRITIKKPDAQLEVNSPLHILGFLAAEATEKTTYDFSQMYEFSYIGDLMLFRGKGRASTFKITGGAVAHNLFSALNMSTNVAEATETSTLYHTQRPPVSYNTSSLNFGGNFSAVDGYYSGNIEIGGNETLTGNLNIGGAVTSAGNLSITSGVLSTSNTTASLFNTTVTTLNIGQAATTMNIGQASTAVAIPGAVTVTTSIKISALAGGGRRALYVDDAGLITI